MGKGWLSICKRDPSHALKQCCSTQSSWGVAYCTVCRPWATHCTSCMPRDLQGCPRNPTTWIILPPPNYHHHTNYFFPLHHAHTLQLCEQHEPTTTSSHFCCLRSPVALLNSSKLSRLPPTALLAQRPQLPPLQQQSNGSSCSRAGAYGYMLTPHRLKSMGHY